MEGALRSSGILTDVLGCSRMRFREQARSYKRTMFFAKSRNKLRSYHYHLVKKRMDRASTSIA